MELHAQFIRAYLIRQVRQFDQMFSGNVFPIFADPEAQAARVAQDVWNQLIQQADDSEGDPASYAEQAHEESLAFFNTLTAMHTTVLNLFTAGLRHLFEQQLAILYDDHSGESENHKPLPLRRWLRERTTVDVTAAPAWAKLKQLRLVANVVKHAEGDSATELRQINPIYFREPLIRQPGYEDIPALQDARVEGPLMGEDIYVTKADYDEFLNAIIEFWSWVASQLERAGGNG